MSDLPEYKTQSKNRRLLERLVRCECDSTPATLCNAAHIRRDERVLPLEIDQQDLWAKDILYHRSCYTSYVAPRALQQKLEKDLAAEDKADHASATETAFHSLTVYFVKNIINCAETVTNMSDLCSLYVDFLRQHGVEVSSYRTCLLKARLVRHFGNQLSFHRPQKRNVTEFVFSSAVAPGKLVEMCALAMANAQRAVEENFSASDILDLPPDSDALSVAPALEVYKAAHLLGSELLTLKNSMPTPSPHQLQT